MSLLAHPWGETIFFLWIAQNQEWVEPGVWSNSLFCKSLRLEQLKQQGGVIVTSLCGFLPSPAKATPHQPSTGSVCVQCLQRLFSRQPPQMPCCAVLKPAVCLPWPSVLCLCASLPVFLCARPRAAGNAAVCHRKENTGTKPLQKLFLFWRGRKCIFLKLLPGLPYLWGPCLLNIYLVIRQCQW